MGSLKKPKAPPPPQPIKIEPIEVPKVEPPAPMPIADEQGTLASQRRYIRERMAKSGRASTILSDSSDKLG